MSKLKKCLYLIHLLERKGAMSLKEINEAFRYSSLYDDDIQPRTFARYKEFIADIFPCSIEYNQRTGKYELVRDEKLYGEEDSLYDYLLSAYHIEGMTELALKHRDRIMLMDAPNGVENVQIVLEAIDQQKGLECDYWSYNKKSKKHLLEGRTFRLHASDADKLAKAVGEAFSDIADQYYLEDDVSPMVSTRKDRITITIPVVHKP